MYQHIRAEIALPELADLDWANLDNEGNLNLKFALPTNYNDESGDCVFAYFHISLTELQFGRMVRLVRGMREELDANEELEEVCLGSREIEQFLRVVTQ